jgi:hypothetical protein
MCCSTQAQTSPSLHRLPLPLMMVKTKGLCGKEGVRVERIEQVVSSCASLPCFLTALASQLQQPRAV